MCIETINRRRQIFFKFNLNIPYELDLIPFPKQSKKIPSCYTFDEVTKLFTNASNLKHKTILILTYSSGLRVSEVVNLKFDDIIRDKMLLKIRQGKGDKDRYAILSKIALKYLEKYWKTYHPKNWLFTGYNNKQLSIRACQHSYEIAKKNAGITKRGGIHTLRHSFATHFLETGGGIFQLQKFMGHKQLRTTLKYVHLQEEKVIARSPLDVYCETNGK